MWVNFFSSRALERAGLGLCGSSTGSGVFAFSCLIGAVRMGCRQNFGFLGRRGAWGWQFRATPHAEPYCPRDQTSGPLVRGSGSAFRI